MELKKIKIVLESGYESTVTGIPIIQSETGQTIVYKDNSFNPMAIVALIPATGYLEIVEDRKEGEDEK